MEQVSRCTVLLVLSCIADMPRGTVRCVCGKGQHAPAARTQGGEAKAGTPACVVCEPVLSELRRTVLDVAGTAPLPTQRWLAKRQSTLIQWHWVLACVPQSVRAVHRARRALYVAGAMRAIPRLVWACTAAACVAIL